MKKFFLAGLMLSGCASLNSVSITQIPSQRQNTVESKVSKFVFLGFNFNNDYVDQVTEELREKCKGGKVEGILTKHETKSYVLFFDHIITARGFCNKAS